MTLPRPPIVRPTLEATVGDAHSRVRHLEAGQMLPYFCCEYEVSWPVNSLPLNFVGGTIGTGSTTNFSAPGNEYYSVFNTDPTVFVPSTQSGDVCNVVGGGLFQWGVRIRAYGSAVGPCTAMITSWEDINLAGGAGSAICGPFLKTVTSPLYDTTAGAKTYYDTAPSVVSSARLAVDGLQSHNGGLIHGMGFTSQIAMRVTGIHKGNATGTAVDATLEISDLRVDVYIVRLSPIGAFDFSECSD